MQPKVIDRNIRKRLKKLAPELALADEVRLRRDRWIRQSIKTADLGACLADVRHGRVYTVKMISHMLHCSEATVRKRFGWEPGVLKQGTFLRVPETVLRRVMREIVDVDTPNHDKNFQ